MISLTKRVNDALTYNLRVLRLMIKRYIPLWRVLFGPPVSKNQIWTCDFGEMRHQVRIISCDRFTVTYVLLPPYTNLGPQTLSIRQFKYCYSIELNDDTH